MNPQKVCNKMLWCYVVLLAIYHLFLGCVVVSATNTFPTSYNARCICDSDEGEILYWTSSHNPSPTEALSGYDLALVIESDACTQPEDFCLCTEDEKCYHPSGASYEVEILPFCQVCYDGSQVQIGLTLDTDVINAIADNNNSFTTILGGCSCSQGNRFYWINRQIIGEMDAYYPDKSSASLPDVNSVAFIIKSLKGCPDLCICDIYGECYHSEGFSEVHFVPSCTYDICRMWAYVYQTPKYGPLLYENGTIYEGPNPSKDWMWDDPGLNHLYAQSVSCHGCESIRNAMCNSAPLKVCSNTNDTASLVIVDGVIPGNIDNLKNPIGVCQCTHGFKYLWPTLNESTPTKVENQAAFIIKSGSVYDTTIWCISDEDGVWYTPSNPKNFYIVFLPFCENNECHMYTIVHDDTYDSSLSGRPLMYLNGSFYTSPNHMTDPIGVASHYIKASTIGRSRLTCAEVTNGICVGPPTIIDMNLGESRIEKLPYPFLILHNQTNDFNDENLSLIYNAINHIDLLETSFASELGPFELFAKVLDGCQTRCKFFGV